MSAGEPQAPVYPLSLRLAGRRTVVVGGGPVAVRRVAGLRAAQADVVVVAPELSPTLADLVGRGLITAHQRAYEPGDLSGAWLALACTDRPDVNAAVAADAERQRIWCVRADDAEASAAWVPAVGRSGGVTLAVNAGRNPRRAALLRDRLLAAVETAGAGTAASGEPGRGAQDAPGLVSIVGGGPGDPGLITVAGRQRLAAADVVVADRLGPLELLDELPPEVQIIDAANVPGGPAMRQDRINQALVEHARAGRAVVRLKGGDPFVFGRGREELDACLAAGVPVEVVPGVTSAVAVPAAAGIPVTHRGLSQGFCVVAGHAAPVRSTIDWMALARSGLTLVLLMGIEHLADTARALRAGGMPASTPGACVSDGWSKRQRVVTAPLAELADAVGDAGITNPAVIVIGDVARFGPASPGTPADPTLTPSTPGTWAASASPITQTSPSPGAPPRDALAEPAPDSPWAVFPASSATGGQESAVIMGEAAVIMGSVGPEPQQSLDHAHTGGQSLDHAHAASHDHAHAADEEAAAGRARRHGAGQGEVGQREPRQSETRQSEPRQSEARQREADLEGDGQGRAGRRVLVLGGARSGKSAAAEGMLTGAETVDYVATGAPPGSGDAEWDTRVGEHRRRRPQHWRTVETLALEDVLAAPEATVPALVDCLTVWLARVMDDAGAWYGGPGAQEALACRLDRLVAAWRDTRRQVVAVSNEIGAGVVPETASGRRFRDELGRLNARIAALSDEVWFCTAGIPRRLR